MKRYDNPDDNGWMNECENGEWIKVADLLKHLKSINITAFGNLAEIDTKTNKIIAGAVYELIEELEK